MKLMKNKRLYILLAIVFIVFGFLVLFGLRIFMTNQIDENENNYKSVVFDHSIKTPNDIMMYNNLGLFNFAGDDFTFEYSISESNVISSRNQDFLDEKISMYFIYDINNQAYVFFDIEYIYSSTDTSNQNYLPYVYNEVSINGLGNTAVTLEDLSDTTGLTFDSYTFLRDSYNEQKEFLETQLKRLNIIMVLYLVFSVSLIFVISKKRFKIS